MRRFSTIQPFLPILEPLHHSACLHPDVANVKQEWEVSSLQKCRLKGVNHCRRAYPNLAVVVPRGDAPAVPGESTAPDAFLMSLQRVDALPGLAVPQLGREKHLESEAGIKEIKSGPKRVPDPHRLKGA